jgi:glycosyltransferase involved in cell wall biosynthesis
MSRHAAATACSIPRLAIAHEWLAERAGSEKTFEAMAEAFPEADLFALTREPSVPFEFGGRHVETTLLDRSALLRRRRDLTLPLMPLVWALVRPAATYDRVLTSSHACVKAFPPARSAEHFCYVHAPMRYAWGRDIDPRAHARRWAAAWGLEALRRWDRRANATVDHFAANSTAVRDRIRRFYGRDARVIFPPVDTEFFTPSDERPRRGALAVSRFVPYKRLDLAIEACARAGLPVTIAGSGSQEPALRARAQRVGIHVRFELSPSDVRLRELYRSSEVLVFPANEDFGLVPVEAQGCGTPVLGVNRGGARDTVIHRETGFLAAGQDADLLAAGLRELLSAGIDSRACRSNAERFGRARFQRELRAWIG